ncbi:MAG TPA: alpha-amylase family glycosyl hydrolase [Gemmatimonadales bacterium]|nr:alpha-amylase family glycosyl hydrolase [Gemmatimonadales bacterium]
MRTYLVLATAGLALGAVLPAPAQARPDTSWVARSAIYEVNVRDFAPAGNLAGVTAGLDRIQAVGANVIWLMPIYPVGIKNAKGPLGSPYAVRNYAAIDSAFGTEADLRALVKAVHARGMKIILDWVPDHTAWDNPWIAAHPDYYVHNDKGEISVPVDPGGHLTDWTDVAQLDYKNPALRRAMIAAMRWWLTRFDIDGYRVDAAGFVPDQFWREAVPALRSSVKRRILLLAEWGDLKMVSFGFDLTYPWESYGRLKAVWKGAPADSFVRAEIADVRAIPPGGARLRFTTNHDETAWDQPPIALFGHGSGAGARAAYAAMALMPGRPLIYDGQEVESPQRLGLFERDSVVWGQPRAEEARGFYRKVVDLARTDTNFLRGDFEAVATGDPADVIAYRRGGALVLVNARDHEAAFTVSGVAVNGLRDRLADAVQQGDTVHLPAYGALVLER